METQQSENNQQPGAVTEQLPVQPSADAKATDSQPFKVFGSQEELDRFMADRAKRAERKALNSQARTLGYEDWQEMQDALEAIRKTPQNAEQPADSPVKAYPGKGVDEAAKLRMALTVAGELNLPAALIGRLQGNTVEEMKADAQLLVGLFQQPASAAVRPGIPSVPQGNQPVTFTRAQLQDAEFVRAHKDDILKAAREGRIVNS